MIERNSIHGPISSERLAGASPSSFADWREILVFGRVGWKVEV
jgi:hypothetical protein